MAGILSKFKRFLKQKVRRVWTTNFVLLDVFKRQRRQSVLPLICSVARLDSLTRMLSILNTKTLSDELVRIACIDRFARFGWGNSLVSALSMNSLGRFLNASTIAKGDLEPHYSAIYKKLGLYARNDLTRESVLEFKYFIGSSDARFCSTLSIFKDSSFVVSEFWYEVFLCVYKSSNPSVRLRRRFVSYLLTYHHLLGKRLSDEEREIVNAAIASKILDLNDILLISQKLDLERTVSFAEQEYAESLMAQRSEVAKYDLVLANLSKANSEGWCSSVNDYLRIFDVSPLKPLTESNFQLIEFETVDAGLDYGLVTIGMPAFNAENTIAASLKSLLNQSYSNLEVIVVDDLSTDDTCKIVLELAEKDARIKLIQNEVNCGPYVCRNVALKLGRGKYFTINDADDLSHSDRIVSHVELIEKNSAFAVESKMLRISNDLTIVSDMKGNFLRKNPSSLLFRREEMLAEFGYWDTVRYGADSELFGRLNQAKKIIIESPKPYLFARFGMQNLSIAQNNIFRGVSGNRKAYRDAFRAYHSGAEHEVDLKYDFFCERPFSVPASMQVDANLIVQTLEVLVETS